MEPQELKTAAYLKEDALKPVEQRVPENPATKQLMGCLAALIVFIGGIMMLLGDFGVLFAASDLFQIPIMNDQYLESPLSLFAKTRQDLWNCYAFSMAVFVLGTVAVGSQRSDTMAAVVYVMCPITAIAAVIGWPLRALDSMRAWFAVLYAGAGVAIGIVGWNGFQTEIQKGSNERIIVYSFALEAGISLLAGGFLAMIISLKRSPPKANETEIAAGNS